MLLLDWLEQVLIYLRLSMLLCQRLTENFLAKSSLVHVKQE